MARIGSMRLRAGQGEITDMSSAGSRLTRLQPTYIDAVAQRSFVEPAPETPQAPPAPPRIGAVEMARRIDARGAPLEPDESARRALHVVLAAGN